LPGGLVPALSVVPASTMVLPAKAELSTVRIVLPLPMCRMVPLPKMRLSKVKTSERLKASVAP
jgi:hypothetical protein